MKLKLFQGITAPNDDAENIISNIKENGLVGKRYNIPNIKYTSENIELFFLNDNLTLDDIPITSDFGICACGDEIGARYYALEHNVTKSSQTSIIITLEADIENIYIDCRDFLCTVFQSWSRKIPSQEQLEILKNLYGENIIRYLERSISLPTNRGVGILMANLACFDKNIILFHSKNDKVIKGRYNTCFCSAFFVKTPINSSDIIDCQVIEGSFNYPTIYIDINDCL